MIRIGTRASALALWQAKHIQTLLHEAWPEMETELVPMTTTGDQILDRPLAAIGGKGLFVKELEQAMLDGRIDLAVHSLKDMPTEQPEGLMLDAIVPRAPAFDVLCGRDHAYSLATLPRGARVGTGSKRREAQLRSLRPDLEIVPLRGNVQTRLAKRHSENLDAIVLAEAGLRRLDIWEPTFSVIAPEDIVPAPGQGAVVVERRTKDSFMARMLAPIHCPKTDLAVSAERACLQAVGGDCHTPFAAWARFDEKGLELVGRISNGSKLVEARGRVDSPAHQMVWSEAKDLGCQVGAELLLKLNA